jgi:hypothetical protein
MKDTTIRGLDNAISILFYAPEFDRIRMFLISDASTGAGENEEIIKHVTDEIRSHLVAHFKAALAARRGI